MSISPRSSAGPLAGLRAMPGLGRLAAWRPPAERASLGLSQTLASHLLRLGQPGLLHRALGPRGEYPVASLAFLLRRRPMVEGAGETSADGGWETWESPSPPARSRPATATPPTALPAPPASLPALSGDMVLPASPVAGEPPRSAEPTGSWLAEPAGAPPSRPAAPTPPTWPTEAAAERETQPADLAPASGTSQPPVVAPPPALPLLARRALDWTVLVSETAPAASPPPPADPLAAFLALDEPAAPPPTSPASGGAWPSLHAAPPTSYHQQPLARVLARRVVAPEPAGAEAVSPPPTAMGGLVATPPLVLARTAAAALATPAPGEVPSSAIGPSVAGSSMAASPLTMFDQPAVAAAGVVQPTPWPLLTQAPPLVTPRPAPAATAPPDLAASVPLPPPSAPLAAPPTAFTESAPPPLEMPLTQPVLPPAVGTGLLAPAAAEEWPSAGLLAAATPAAATPMPAAPAGGDQPGPDDGGSGRPTRLSRAAGGSLALTSPRAPLVSGAWAVGDDGPRASGGEGMGAASAEAGTWALPMLPLLARRPEASPPAWDEAAAMTAAGGVPSPALVAPVAPSLVVLPPLQRASGMEPLAMQPAATVATPPAATVATEPAATVVPRSAATVAMTGWEEGPSASGPVAAPVAATWRQRAAQVAARAVADESGPPPSASVSPLVSLTAPAPLPLLLRQPTVPTAPTSESEVAALAGAPVAFAPAQPAPAPASWLAPPSPALVAPLAPSLLSLPPARRLADEPGVVTSAPASELTRGESSVVGQPAAPLAAAGPATWRQQAAEMVARAAVVAEASAPETGAAQTGAATSTSTPLPTAGLISAAPLPLLLSRRAELAVASDEAVGVEAPVAQPAPLAQPAAVGQAAPAAASAWTSPPTTENPLAMPSPALVAPWAPSLLSLPPLQRGADTTTAGEPATPPLVADASTPFQPAVWRQRAGLAATQAAALAEAGEPMAPAAGLADGLAGGGPLPLLLSRRAVAEPSAAGGPAGETPGPAIPAAITGERPTPAASPATPTGATAWTSPLATESQLSVPSPALVAPWAPSLLSLPPIEPSVGPGRDGGSPLAASIARAAAPVAPAAPPWRERAAVLAAEMAGDPAGPAVASLGGLTAAAPLPLLLRQPTVSLPPTSDGEAVALAGVPGAPAAVGSAPASAGLGATPAGPAGWLTPASPALVAPVAPSLLSLPPRGPAAETGPAAASLLAAGMPTPLGPMGVPVGDAVAAPSQAVPASPLTWRRQAAAVAALTAAGGEPVEPVMASASLVGGAPLPLLIGRRLVAEPAAVVEDGLAPARPAAEMDASAVVSSPAAAGSGSLAVPSPALVAPWAPSLLSLPPLQRVASASATGELAAPPMLADAPEPGQPAGPVVWRQRAATAAAQAATLAGVGEVAAPSPGLADSLAGGGPLPLLLSRRVVAEASVAGAPAGETPGQVTSTAITDERPLPAASPATPTGVTAWTSPLATESPLSVPSPTLVAPWAPSLLSLPPLQRVAGATAAGSPAAPSLEADALVPGQPMVWRQRAAVAAAQAAVLAETGGLVALGGGADALNVPSPALSARLAPSLALLPPLQRRAETAALAGPEQTGLAAQGPAMAIVPWRQQVASIVASETSPSGEPLPLTRLASATALPLLLSRQAGPAMETGEPVADEPAAGQAPPPAAAADILTPPSLTTVAPLAPTLVLLPPRRATTSTVLAAGVDGASAAPSAAPLPWRQRAATAAATSAAGEIGVPSSGGASAPPSVGALPLVARWADGGTVASEPGPAPLGFSPTDALPGEALPLPLLARRAGEPTYPALSAAEPPTGERPVELRRFALQRAAESTGAPLPLPVRAPFERLFNTSFAEVEVHTGAAAAEATAAVGASAMAIGPRLFFAPGRFQPEAPEGSALLAHELTHVVQQRTSPLRMALKSASPVVQSDAPADEPAADDFEQRVLAMHEQGRFPAQPLVLARKTDADAARSASDEANQFLGSGTPDGPALGTYESPVLARAVQINEVSTSVGSNGSGMDASENQPHSSNVPAQTVNLLADRVYELLKKRLTTERERIGRWP